MKNTLIAAALLATGCSSPNTPTSVTEQVLRYPPEMAPVIRHLDADAWVHPLLNATPGAYVRRHVREIRFDGALRPPTLAYAYPGGTVGWQTYDAYVGGDNTLDAGYLVHEARHLAGYNHTCGDGRRDRTFEEGGAWAAHIVYLEHHGKKAEANLVRSTFIGC